MTLTSLRRIFSATNTHAGVVKHASLYNNQLPQMPIDAQKREVAYAAYKQPIRQYNALL